MSKVGDRPAGVVVGEGYVWVANAGDGTVSRLDPESGEEVGDAIEVGDSPRGIAISDNSIWVAELRRRHGHPQHRPVAAGTTFQAMEDPIRPRVWVSQGGEAARLFPLAEGTTVIGRGEHCDISLDDESISADHLEIGRRGPSLMAEDLDSRNGTRPTASR